MVNEVFCHNHGWKTDLEIFAADKNQMLLMGIHAILITPRHISSSRLA